jgi:hypothetical protein
MKRILLGVIALVALAMSAYFLTRPSASSTPSIRQNGDAAAYRHHPHFIKSEGEHIVIRDQARVRVYSEDQTKSNFRIWRKEPQGTSEVGPTDAWADKNSQWFIYVESQDQYWAYDGEHDLVLWEFTPRGSRASSILLARDRLVEQMPDDVRSRLPEYLLTSSKSPLPEKAYPPLVKAALTRTGPGKNYPELPPLPVYLITHVVRETATNSDIEAAYKQLDTTKRNVTWFSGIEKLEEQKAMWALLSAVCHPHEDVQIHALRALQNAGTDEAVPFLLEYAKAMAVFESGSENATIHGIIHKEIANTLQVITGLKFDIPDGQDPEALKEIAAQCEEWLASHDRKLLQ